MRLLDSYQLAISNLSAPDELLSVALSNGMSDFRIEADLSNSLRGSLDTINEIYTLSASSVFTVNSDAADPLLGVFDVSIIANVEMPVDSDPVAGEWQIGFSEPGQSQVVTVTVVSGGVTVSLDGGDVQFFTWVDFEGLFGDELAPGWQRRASLSALVESFVVEQADLVRRTVAMIDDSLETTASKTEMCDAFTGAPPAGVVNQGMFTLTWLGSGEIAAGDAFSLEFTDCWSSGEDEGQLANGTVDLTGFQASVDDNTLINFGFLDSAQGPGGIMYNGLTIATTIDSLSGTFTVDPSDTLSVSDGFSISFFGAVP